MFNWFRKKPTPARQSKAQCRLQLVRLEDRKVLNADPVLAEVGQLLEAEGPVDSPVVEQEEIQSRTAEEFDAHKSERLESQEPSRENREVEQAKRQQLQENRRLALAKTVHHGAQQPAESKELVSKNVEPTVVVTDASDRPAETSEPMEETTTETTREIRSEDPQSDEVEGQAEPTVVRKVVVHSTVTTKLDRSATDDSGLDEGETGADIRDEQPSEPDEDGVTEVDDSAGAVPVTSPVVTPVEADAPDSHQPQRGTDRVDAIGHGRDTGEPKVLYAQATASASRAEAQHHASDKATISANVQASPESQPVEPTEPAAALGKGALLMVSLGQPLSRLVTSDDRGADAADDSANLPRSLPSPVARKRNGKNNKNRDKGRGLLAKHRAAQRHVAVKPNANTLTVEQRDQWMATELASFADPPQSESHTGSIHHSGGGMTALATGGVALGSSALFIQHCRSASQSRKAAFRPTLPHFTGTTLASD